MLLLATMNLQARIDGYKERGFQQLEAEILVLIEESAAALFTAFPDQFILFGGVTLVLFYESPRLSRDLDLLASPTQIPRPEEIEDVVRSSIQSIAETLGLGQLEFRTSMLSSARSNSARSCHWPSSKSLPRTNLRLSAARYESCWLIGSGRNCNELDNYPDRRSTKQLHRAHRQFGSQTQAL